MKVLSMTYYLIAGLGLAMSVLTAQAQSQFGSQTAQSFTGRVNNIPVAFYGFWFSCKSFH